MSKLTERTPHTLHMPILTPREAKHLEDSHNAFVKKYMEKHKEKTTAALREARKNGTLRPCMPPRPSGLERRPTSAANESTTPAE
ncbi:MAG: hypothetical protein ACRC46_02400 [Thermoguttaceae bacterium]